MTLDLGPVGELTAKVMDTIEESGLVGATLEDALLVVEVTFTDDDGDECSGVYAKVLSDRSTCALGLTRRADRIFDGEVGPLD